MHLIELIPSNAKDQGGLVEPGFGLKPSPPDDRDLQLHDRLVADGLLPEVLGAEEMLATFPSSFVAGSLPPVTNQGQTPQCVAYSTAMMKAWMDHKDQGAWFDFDERTFFYSIGGGPSGAVLRYGMDRMLNYGYPPNPSVHKIRAYYSASLSHVELKAALMAYGPLVLAVHWPDSWSHPYSNGVVPYPSGVTNGHAILCVGWVDGMGFLFQNSWGTGYGVNGRIYIPASYLSQANGTPIRAFEAWKALDQVFNAPTVPMCTIRANSNIRATPSGTGVLVGHTYYDNRTQYKGTVVGGAYNYWNGSAWTVRTDWAKVVYSGIDRYVVRVNVIV